MGAYKSRRKPKMRGFVALPWDVLNHRAYKELPPSSAKALPYFLGKPKKRFDDEEFYKTAIKFSYREAKKDGFAAGTFSKIIKALVAHGFLDPVDKGGLRSSGKGYNVFKLSLRWVDYGTEQFVSKQWEQYQPEAGKCQSN